MQLPSRYCIQSAQRCARLIGLEAVHGDEVESSFRSAATQGMYRIQDLRSGQSLLEALRLVHRDRETIYPDAALLEFSKCSEDEAIQISLTRLLQATPPMWLTSAIQDGTVVYEYMPTLVVDYFDSVLSDLSRREALLLAVGCKYDADRLREVGLQGELAVLDACRKRLAQAGRQDLCNEVIHVSMISDQLGYDIVSPTVDGRRVRIEVKSTGSLTDYAVYISRLEAQMGHADEDWRLVFCRNRRDETHIVGHCGFSAIAPQLPCDRPPGQWSSTKLQLGILSLQPGIPL